MAQISWRADDGLVARVRLHADRAGTSMNAYITHVLETATDPDYGGDAAERLRDRLRMAGLLAEHPVESDPDLPSDEEFEAARREAGRGTPLSDLVIEGR
ncbi:MAG: transcriptional regulator [Acidimicrobiales bacterium]